MSVMSDGWIDWLTDWVTSTLVEWSIDWLKVVCPFQDYSDIALKSTSKKEPKRRKNAKSTKKKSRRNHNDFILDEAEVDDDDEEEEWEGEEGFDDYIAAKDRHHGTGEDGPSARDLESRRRLDEMFNKDEKDIEAYYR